MNSADPHDSFTSARAFHATRLDWLYLTGNESIDKTFVAKAKEHGYLIGGTLNGSLHDTPASRSFDVGRTVDLRGEPLKDPWTKKWGMRFGCPNHPDYAKVFLDHARYALGMGVDHYQMDGVQLNEIMVAYGGCFCPYCIEGFREHLAAHSTAGQRTQWGLGELSTFNYAKFLLALGTAPNSALNVVKGPKELRDLFREFQTESGVRFLAKMHEEIDRMAGRELAYSCNANREFLTTYHRVHDFAFIEAYPFREGTPAFLYEQRLKKAQELGKSCLMTFVSDDVDHNRRFIATSYALGANVVVPWDVFTGFETPRFFGTPEQFAAVLDAGAAAIRRGNPDARIVGFCPELSSLNFPRKVAALTKTKVDVFSFHAYFQNVTGGGTADFAQELALLLKTAKQPAGIEAWNSEGTFGAAGTNSFYSFLGDPRVNEWGAAFGSRVWLSTAAAGFRKTFIYTLHQTDTIMYHGGYKTLINYDRSITPSAVATAVTAYCMDGMLPIACPKVNQGAAQYAFAEEGRTVWSTFLDPLAKQPVLLHVGKLPATWEVLDAMGNDPRRDGVGAVTLGLIPIFVRATDMVPARMVQTCNAALGPE